MSPLLLTPAFNLFSEHWCVYRGHWVAAGWENDGQWQPTSVKRLYHICWRQVSANCQLRLRATGQFINGIATAERNFSQAG